MTPWTFDGTFFRQHGKFVPGHLLDEAVAAPRHMLVTGNGRGGTTACAMILEALGFETFADRTNERESPATRKRIFAGDVDGALADLKTWREAAPRRFWKDPKLWSANFDDFLDRLPPDIGILFVFRDPLNIATRNAALAESDLLTELGNAARRTHEMTQRVAALGRDHVALVSYEKLLVDAPRVVESLARFLNVTDSKRIAAAVASVAPTPAAYQANFRPRAS